LQGYATEYDQQWTQVAQRGDSALMLYTTATFGENLRGTASVQAQETEKLQAHSQKLLQQALQDSRRVEALQNYMARQQALRRAQAERREHKQLEDDLNARRARS
jgi:flagellar biosynthesis chaperone FliJ